MFAEHDLIATSPETAKRRLPSPRLPILPALVLGAAIAVPAAAGDLKAAGTIESTGSGLKFPDGSVQSRAFDDWANVLVVAGSGGDFTAIQAALDSISDAAADNRYLVRIGPGVFNEQVTMKAFVDVEGAGEGLTTMTAGGSPDPLGGTVICADHSELRSVTVENSGGDTYAIAINCSDTSPQLSYLRAVAAGGTIISAGVRTAGATTTEMRGVTAIGDGGANAYGVFTDATSSPLMTGVEAVGMNGSVQSTGVFTSAGAPSLTDVVARGIGSGLANYGVRSTVGGAPQLLRVTAEATGAATDNYAVFITDASVSIRYSELSASGATNNYGVYETGATAPRTVTIEVSRITASTHSIRSETDFVTLLAFSFSSGGGFDVSNGGGLFCNHNWDETLATSC